jgi:endogenous inhibitor of DNA gyrase (YacG/DUF329 family)
MRIRCPVCSELTTWEENPWRPFCSERCKLIDLGKWAAEEYRIPGKKEEEEDETESREEQSSD